MSILLDQPAIRARVHRVSPEHYHQMGALGLVTEKHELLYGYIIDKMPKSPLHERIKMKLLKLLNAALSDVFEARLECPLSIGDSEPEPDISVVKGTPDDWADAHPTTAELVIEIAVTSLETDLEKANIYASAAVPEYWIVRAEEGEIDVFRKPVAGQYTAQETITANNTLQCSVIAGFALVPAELFAIRKG